MHYNKGQRLSDLNLYKKLIRKLIYLSLTCPDITFTVNHLSQFATKPYEAHFQGIIQVLRYLKSNPGQGIIFSRDKNFNVSAHYDAD
jgi:hypothetical protein